MVIKNIFKTTQLTGCGDGYGDSDGDGDGNGDENGETKIP